MANLFWPATKLWGELIAEKVLDKPNASNRGEPPEV
jgi:hypothetical protein